MSSPSQTNDNELDNSEDLAFQRRWWIVERTGWLVMFLVVVAGAAGLLGRSPASRAEVTDGSASLKYERLARLHAPSDLALHVLQSPTASRELSISLSREYCRDVRVVDITPTPESSTINDAELTYRFRLEPGQTGMPIDFKLNMETLGRLEGWVRIREQPPLRLSQFVYP